MGSFETQSTIIKFFIGIVAVLIIASFVYKINFITDAKRTNKPVYEIEVNTYNHIEIYTTTEYIRDQSTGCIRFKDAFGIKRVVCNNYTITEY